MKNYKRKLNIVRYDRENDVLYFGIRGGAEEEYVEVAPGINVELDRKRQVIGIEVLNASKVLRPVAKSLESRALARSART